MYNSGKYKVEYCPLAQGETLEFKREKDERSKKLKQQGRCATKNASIMLSIYVRACK